MRIAYLSHFYPPTHNAGIEQNVHSVAKGMQKMGHQVAVLCMGNWDQGEPYIQGQTTDIWEGIHVQRLHINWRRAKNINSYLYDNPELGVHIKQFLYEFTPDVVHITSLYTFSATAVGVIKELKIPIVFTLSDFWSICPRNSLMHYDGSICDGRVTASACEDCMLSESRTYRKLKSALPKELVLSIYRLLSGYPAIYHKIPGVAGWGINIHKRREVFQEHFPKVDYAIAPSMFVREKISANTCIAPIHLSHYGNELDWIKNYEPRPDDGEIHFGYIGQIIPIKGIHLLISAFQNGLFSDRVKLLIYGKTDSNPQYTQQLNELIQGNPNIQIMGPYLRPELHKVLANIDVLVVPSIWPEVAGLVVQEAFAVQIPVIASKRGGLVEFVQEGQGGMQFDPDKLDTLTNILQKIVNEGRTKIEHLRQAIPHVRTTDEECEYLSKVYHDLIEKSVSTRQNGETMD